MVTFVSLFLSLVTGLHPVTVAVDETVAEVEMVLDGSSLGVVRGQPWTLSCDFGDQLVPHELVAISRDAHGKELTRAVQWINLPRSRSEIGILLENGPDGLPRYADLHWQSIDRREPDELSVTWNGVELTITDYQIELPDYNPMQTHLLVAKSRFGRTAASTEMIIGGSIGGMAAAEMTAVPVLLRRWKRLPKSPQDLAGWFLKAGKPLSVAAIEHGPSELIVIHDLTQRMEIRLDSVGSAFNLLSKRRPPGTIINTHHLPSRPDTDSRLRLLFPVAGQSTQATQPTSLFPLTPGLPGGVLSILMATCKPHYYADSYQIEQRFQSPQMIADAVAVAGLAAATGCRPRAVVVIVSKRTEDSSSLTAIQAAGYLQSLHVPLVIWSPFRSKYQGPWGKAVEISTDGRLIEATSDLCSLLDRQVVIWVAGRHLPQQIELSARAQKSFSLVGGHVIPSDL